MTQEERIDRYVEFLVSVAPPATAEQKWRLQGLFAQGERKPVAARGRRAA